MNLLSKATGLRRSTLGDWSVRWCWGTRIAKQGLAADRDAAMVYRETYLESEAGGREKLDRIFATIRPQAWLLLGVGSPVPQVDDLEVPDEGLRGEPGDGKARSDSQNGEDSSERVLSKMEQEARKRADAAAEAHRRAIEETKRRQEEAARERERVAGVFRRAQGLLELYLAHLGRQAQQRDAAGELIPVDVRPRDLPKILEQYRELSELLGIVQPSMQQGPALEPSYRVQLAQSTNGDVLQALWDDVLECQAIVGGLVARRDAAMAASPLDKLNESGELHEARGGQEGHPGE